MKIETKFNVGDVVWFWVHNNPFDQITKDKIVRINITIEQGSIVTEYHMNKNYVIINLNSEKDLMFKTKTELINALMNKLEKIKEEED